MINIEINFAISFSVVLGRVSVPFIVRPKQLDQQKKKKKRGLLIKTEL